MFYIMYLTGLCQRRHWPEPLYDVYRSRHGYTCTVRVNNREYTTDQDQAYGTEDLARNAAATHAYMICRNFSVNDGMYPGQRPGQGGVIQGLPVAIGTGRRNTQSSINSEGSTVSGGSSPRSSDSGLEPQRYQTGKASASYCVCGRGQVQAYDRCRGCLRDVGYTA